MTREQLGHVIRAASAITKELSFVEKRILQPDPSRPISTIVAWAHLRAQESQS